MKADALRACCDDCRTKLARLEAAGVREPLLSYFADPLLSVDLRDRRWPERFDASHPGRLAK